MSAPQRCVVKGSIAAANQALIAFAEAQMVHAVQIRRHGGPSDLDYSTGAVIDGAQVVYDGIAYVGDISGGDPMIQGDEMQFWDHTTVKIPATGATVRIDDVVTITAATDSTIIGRKMRVASISSGGSLLASQALYCVGVAPSRSNPAVP